jgi:hypothetical protein
MALDNDNRDDLVCEAGLEKVEPVMAREIRCVPGSHKRFRPIILGVGVTSDPVRDRAGEVLDFGDAPEDESFFSFRVEHGNLLLV